MSITYSAARNAGIDMKDEVSKFVVLAKHVPEHCGSELSKSAFKEER